MLTDYEITQMLNPRSLQGGNNDSPWWLLFARDIERRVQSECALDKLAEDAQRMGLYHAPSEAWAQGFSAGHAWCTEVARFWETHEYGQQPEPPANPYAARHEPPNA